ncbi:hypothetical protein [Chryseobacterium sp. Leaf394]|uniref:hypothetical protein n=1 Tax=Chryseobacterium sp. Leaf394 TaxID=1736361 RepID=UPI0006F881A5|nr:hypothetical protein [Chryseobacterium sp. Leaf394]KQS91270.1 hypothetical protein ASG21_01910 [Chryseobacterium sp. Leaf394]
MDVKEYFQSYRDYFWEWQTDNDIEDDLHPLASHNIIYFPTVASVVGYRVYIIEILKELQLQGWPPFGALLLVLYATQDGYKQLRTLTDGLKKHISREEIETSYNEAVFLLKKLEILDRKYKTGRNRVFLLQALFAGNKMSLTSAKSRELCDNHVLRPNIIERSANVLELTGKVFRKDINALAYINQKFPTTESIEKALQGIIEIPELEDEVVEEETTVETDKDFIQELIEEPKTFQVGSLIKRIWSGLRIPMRHLSPGEQPIGGVSDMTNKGDFSRMLLSEFANDDEVFMNRVANNEALYIQREIPPEENIFERIILIDTSLKNWGTPKVLAFASAIAVIKHPKAHSECKVFALGQNTVPIKLDKVDEVIENLNHVSPVLEVSQALQKFFDEEHTEKNLEVFFITHQDNLNNQNLQKVIHENRDQLKFLVTTSADGELNFYKHHKGTRKHVQKMMLPLQELWANPPKYKQKSLNTNSGNSKKADVPLNYPILFPVPVNKIAAFLHEGDFYVLSSKKQLLKTYLSDNYYNKDYYEYYHIHRGCEVLIENISVKPKGQFALARNKAQHFILAQYLPEKRFLSKLNLNTKEYSELSLTGRNIPHSFELIYFNKKFYLRDNESLQILEFSPDGTLDVETVDNNIEITKSNIKIEAELKKLNHSGIKILSNFTSICINAEENLVISHNEINKLYDNSLTMYRNRHQLQIFAQQNKNRFTFTDGSEVITDTRGMLTFRSSNKNIPEFYIPSSDNGFLAMATEKDFGGSEYYLPKKSLLRVRKMEEMYSEYLEPFIEQIWEHGT